MPKWKKSPPDLIALFDRALPDDPSIERRKMFGYPCAFVNGNMVTGLFADQVFLRLSDGERSKLIASGAAAPFEPLPGRVMKDYVVLTDSAPSEPTLRKAIARALAFALTLPLRRKK